MLHIFNTSVTPGTNRRALLPVLRLSLTFSLFLLALLDLSGKFLKVLSVETSMSTGETDDRIKAIAW